MEATVLSVGKSVLDGALGYAKSALAEEVALQLGVQRDHAFIRDELEMMQSFLMSAHEDRDNHKVLTTWVKQIRDVAYDAEDSLLDFSVHLQTPSWWCLPSTLRQRRRIAKKMKDLRARVEDVSQRNQRYQLIRTSAGPKPATMDEQSSITAATVLGIDEAQQAAKPKEDLASLINREDVDLRVIAVWGTHGVHGKTSTIRAAYENPDIKGKFPCRAWVKVMKPFHPKHFVQALVKQFRSMAGVDALLDIDNTWEELTKELYRYMNENRYLVVLNDLSAIEEWDEFKTCFPDNKKGSRIIVCTSQVEVASLCAGQESVASELMQLSVDHTIYAFYDKDFQHQTRLPIVPISSSNATSTNQTLHASEINECESKGAAERNTVTKSLTHINTMTRALMESQIISREKEKLEIIDRIMNQSAGQQLSVISVWGMGGLGKTTIVREVFQSQKLIDMFDKRAFVPVLRPFILKDLLKSLIMQLDTESFDKKGVSDSEQAATMQVTELITKLQKLLEGKKCLIVLDDLWSTTEWDHIKLRFSKLDDTCRIVVTTREVSIAKHCSGEQGNIYHLEVLQDNEALDLFTRKVFKKPMDLEKHHPELIEEARLILKKCKGLPLAIVTIGGLLANQPKKAAEWRKLNENISAELEMNPELQAIKTILGKSYDGLPYDLKSCFLYLSIFPEDEKISRGRLTRRWTAEGYSSGIREKSAEEISDNNFLKLIDRSMILPSGQSLSIDGIEETDSCQVHDLMREISISKSREENLVFILEEGCSSNNSQATARHLVVSSDWKGDKDEFESTLDLSRLRSLTVFGEFRSFFISDKLRLLRVLDLENTSGLVDHHLEHIGRLLHLRYLSLKYCNDIYHLPDSLGNLKQLETLDIQGTYICELPKSIVKLGKLQYLFGGDGTPMCFWGNKNTVPDDMTKLCASCCAPKFLKDVERLQGDPNIRDVCSFWSHVVFPALASRRRDWCGVIVPRGIRKLNGLRTLGVVSIAGAGKYALKDIRRLVQLRSLAVSGINRRNYEELCSTLAHLGRLESLSVVMLTVGSTGSPIGVLEGTSAPSMNLQRLTWEGELVKLPEWIGKLQNLVSLRLLNTRLTDWVATTQVLCKLPNLAFLLVAGFVLDTVYNREICLKFHGDGEAAFPSLMELQLIRVQGLGRVEFGDGALPKLEHLHFVDNDDVSFSGLASLPRLNGVHLYNGYPYREATLAGLQAQLEQNRNRPVLMWHS